MNRPDLLAINKQIESFPALPAIVTKVMAVTANPESSANDLMEVVLPDQAMCSAILKVANSAFFGVPREVSTMERAVVVLGFEEIRNIIIGKAIFASFPRMDKENRQRVNLLWEHALTCGLAAKIIAESLNLSPSELFIAGLIHDIGKLAMIMTYPHDYSILGDLSNPGNYRTTTEEEENAFAINHEKVSLQLANRWLLPEKLVMAMGYHHTPHDAPCHKHYPLIVQLADILSLVYLSQATSTPWNMTSFFNDFLPETGSLWRSNKLHWDPTKPAIWLEDLKQSCQANQHILDIFTSP